MDITVTMTEPEIIEAIKDFLFKHDVVSQSKEIEVNMVAGRGSNGHSAVIAVKNAVSTVTTAGLDSLPKAEPKEEDIPMYKQVAPAKTQPAPEPVVTKDVPMPTQAQEIPTEAISQAPGEDITAKTNEEISGLFADAQVSESVPAEQGFDENNITEGSTQSVDSLFA